MIDENSSILNIAKDEIHSDMISCSISKFIIIMTYFHCNMHLIADNKEFRPSGTH